MAYFSPSHMLLTKIKQFEGCRLSSYRDIAGVWTIGIGHTAGVTRGMRISEAEALMLLRQDLTAVADGVNSLAVCVSQGQFDALCDFAFNCGLAALRRSTLLRCIRSHRPLAEIQAEFMRWTISGGKSRKGLQIRRRWEAQRFAE